MCYWPSHHTRLAVLCVGAKTSTPTLAATVPCWNSPHQLPLLERHKKTGHSICSTTSPQSPHRTVSSSRLEPFKLNSRQRGPSLRKLIGVNMSYWRGPKGAE